ncbi:MAG: hypothetical protein SFY80_05490 [Verrucomicrobiota bacterium]|nr:hypothetical protein [Verrucomicrobiota bacterium]
MNQEPEDTRPTMQDLFPEMKPIKRVPSLGTLNGFGAGFYGRRNIDDITGTYVTTHCICAVFLPIIALGAYRVLDTGDRSYRIFGRVPLSRFAKGWNKTLLGLALSFALYIGLSAYTGSAEYRARQEMKTAAAQLEEGHVAKAAEAYRTIYNQYPEQREEAKAGLTAALEACLATNTTENEDVAFRVLKQLPVADRESLLPGAFGKGLALVEKRKQSQPAAADKLLGLITPMAPKGQDLLPLRKDILHQWMKAQPTLLPPALELALLAETEADLDTAGKLLEPYKDRLENGEGARILAQWYMQTDRNEDAYTLLFPYVETRLKKYHDAEAKYAKVSDSCYKQALEGLNNGVAGQAFYNNYKSAGKAAQDAMVDKYLNEAVRADSVYQSALKQVQTAGTIVPVALDLGIVQLNRAQGMHDSEARKKALSEAESTFLSIQGAAEESDGYRLYLGQVYYWLGKHKEGRELLEKLLESHQRDFKTLASLAGIATLVGERSWARSLREEAYKTATKKEDKYAIAASLATNGNDIEDRLMWLERADPDSASVKIDFNYNRGIKAASEGDKDTAKTYYNNAIAAYRSVPQTESSLNNEALVHLRLYEVTGYKASLARGQELMEQAIKMSPENTILIGNVASTLLPIGLRELAAESMVVDAIPDLIDLDILTSLYDTAAERTALRERYKNNTSIRKVLDYYDKLLTLAPKNFDYYTAYYSALRMLDDPSATASLFKKLQQSELDLSTSIQSQIDWYSGKDHSDYSKKTRKKLNELETLLSLPAIKGSPATLSYVYISIFDLHMRLHSLGESPDAAALMELATTAHAIHPSANTRGSLLSACFYKAHAQLSSTSLEYKELADRTHRALTPRQLIVFLLEQNGSLATELRKLDAIKEAMKHMVDLEQRFPDRSHDESWACFEHSDADYAATMVAKTKADPMYLLDQEIGSTMYPLYAPMILGNYWKAKMENRGEEAIKLYKKGLMAGVPLPPL